MNSVQEDNEDEEDDDDEEDNSLDAPPKLDRNTGNRKPKKLDKGTKYIFNLGEK